MRIFDKLNEEHFNSTILAGIGWRNLRITKNTQLLGEADFEERFISINTLLQDKRVPNWYLRYIVFHEMLHLHQGYKEGGDQHDAPYRAAEACFPYFKRAKEFEQGPLHKIAKEWSDERKAKRSPKRTSYDN